MQKLSQQEAEAKSIKVGCKLLGVYKNSRTKTKFKCSKCNNTFERPPKAVWIRKNTRCHTCSPTVKLTQQEAEQKSLLVGIKLKGKYLGSHTKAKYECPICKKDWYVTPNTIWTKKSKGCGCLVSYGEHIIKEWLDNQNIIYERQKRFRNCRNKRALPFDFYIPHYGCIEYQGVQHYIPQDFSKRNDIIIARKSFQKLKLRDDIKRKFCQDNNIQLLIIPYTKINHIATILNKQLL